MALTELLVLTRKLKQTAVLRKHLSNKGTVCSLNFSLRKVYMESGPSGMFSS